MQATVIKAPVKAAEQKMDVRSINPFIIAAVSIIKETTGLSVAKENVFVQQGKFIPAGTGITLDISGDIHGKIVYEFSKGVAARISQLIVKRNIDMQTSAVDFKEMLNHAILELGNQIAGKAITLLSQQKIQCHISPPVFFLGTDMQLIHRHVKTIVLVLKTEFGSFSINLALYK
jgi:chemotaxis protein CheX